MRSKPWLFLLSTLCGSLKLGVSCLVFRWVLCLILGHVLARLKPRFCLFCVLQIVKRRDVIKCMVKVPQLDFMVTASQKGTLTVFTSQVILKQTRFFFFVAISTF